MLFFDSAWAGFSFYTKINQHFVIFAKFQKPIDICKIRCYNLTELINKRDKCGGYKLLICGFELTQ